VKIKCALPKWVERPHYRFEADRLGRDEHGTWLGCPNPTAFTGPGWDGEWTHGFVILVPESQGWIASYQGEREPNDIELYVDITTAAEWPDEQTFRAIDLDLDVARFRDGRVELLDEDEFEEHRALFGYPDDVVERALETAQWVLEAVREGREPFGRAGIPWLSKLG
jgi:hypothetical protein